MGWLFLNAAVTSGSRFVDAVTAWQFIQVSAAGTPAWRERSAPVWHTDTGCDCRPRAACAKTRWAAWVKSPWQSDRFGGVPDCEQGRQNRDGSDGQNTRQNDLVDARSPRGAVYAEFRQRDPVLVDDAFVIVVTTGDSGGCWMPRCRGKSQGFRGYCDGNLEGLALHSAPTTRPATPSLRSASPNLGPTTRPATPRCARPARRFAAGEGEAKPEVVAGG